MKLVFLIIFSSVFLVTAHATTENRGAQLKGCNRLGGTPPESTALEPWTYSEDFEHRSLAAWTSYPLWQDIAYDPNLRIDKIVPGDDNLSIVQKVTPYSQVDNYAGAQKLLDMVLETGTELSFRYYLKANERADFFKIRLAAGNFGKIDITIPDPERNKWTWITVHFNDFVKENPSISDLKAVKIFALAFLTKIPKSDPAMPFYLGIDDITFKAARVTQFQFSEPAMYKLPEFSPYIPKEHFKKGDEFRLTGIWPIPAKKIKLEIVSYTDQTQLFYKTELKKKNNEWVLTPLKINFPDGLFLGRLTAWDGMRQLAETEFTIHVFSEKWKDTHPRLLFNDANIQEIERSFNDGQFSEVFKDIAENAKQERAKEPVESLVFDLDQFPDEDWLPTWNAFGAHIYNTDGALRWNALAYAFHKDSIAGNYVKQVLLKLSEWPVWVSPWMIKRGRFSEHRMGTWSHSVALAYDLVYDLMTPDEGRKVRKAIMEKIIGGAFQTYVYDNEVTANSSNWVAHTVGGALMNLAVIANDDQEGEIPEPVFTGSLMKFYNFIQSVTDTVDGSWGEGLVYNHYSFRNMSYSVASLKNVFNVDVTPPLRNTYNEYIWGGIIKDRRWFSFGDSNDDIPDAAPWRFLLKAQKEPRLNWYYNYLKDKETLEDVFFRTDNLPQQNPFDENPVKVFRKVGTTVFKSGWEKDDFVFVMRTGPFFNHQHLDQGSFYIADKGKIFIEDQPVANSNYYDDPLYQSDFTQPVAHSTILIDGNHQSQRVGDPIDFAPGFNDYAFIADFLDGQEAAFSRGDIGRLYWDKVSSLSRNALYIKPGTILMLDEVVPGNKDVEINLLYHTARFEDISAGAQSSAITKDNVSLHITHLAPESMLPKAVETPHYLNTLLKERPLIKEGMLTVSARTNGAPLIMANILTTSAAGVSPEVKSERGEGFVRGITSGKKFGFSTSPGQRYIIEEMKTDALALTWDNNRVFAARTTFFEQKNRLILESDTPLTFEFSDGGLKYYKSKAGKLTIGLHSSPSAVILNNRKLKNVNFNPALQTLTFEVPEGEGKLQFK